MTITLPALEISSSDPSGNVVRHYLHPEIVLDYEVVESNRRYVVISQGETKCCITVSEDHAASDCMYIALVKRAPTAESIQTRLEFRRWIKHPMLRQFAPNETKATWVGKFSFIEEDQNASVPGLREPQVGALYAALSHLKSGDEIGTIVLPTGTGKTETMLSLLMADRCTRVLVTVPSDALRNQIAQKFCTLGYLKRFGIVAGDAVNPIVGILTTKFANTQELENFFNRCNVIIATMDIVAESSNSDQMKMVELCSNLFIDEAHHSKAQGWDAFIKKFDPRKVLMFTATPFRNDGERLEGKIIFNFPLRKAQEQGYFKSIKFLPIREYDPLKADAEIARVAVEKLREDKRNGFDHVLMARCRDRRRAEEVFQIYSQHGDLNPVLIHAAVKKKKVVVENIRALRHSIVVCVDMLGEGFDLPQLKIAAFHDIRKSLPITLQFAGRFTRTSLDARLGEATFVANLFQPETQDELSDLYSRDADWNVLLPNLSYNNVQDQIDFSEFLAGFANLKDSNIPFQNINPALSTVVYQNLTNTWVPPNWQAGIEDFGSYDHKFHSYNGDKRTIVIILGRKIGVQWGNFTEVHNFDWNLIIAYWDSRNNLLFIHGSEKSGYYEELAKALLGDGNFRLISGMEVFKAFSGINRLSLFNVGLRKTLGGNLSFQSYYGRSVADGLSVIQRRQGIKNNIFGVGYENGEAVSLGCSKKGRIWSYLRGNLKDFTIWCNHVGSKLINEHIDPDAVLNGTAIPKIIGARPNKMPIAVDWDGELYKHPEHRFEFKTTAGQLYTLATAEIQLENPKETGPLQFALVADGLKIVFQLDLSERRESSEVVREYSITQKTALQVSVAYGNTIISLEEFFREFVPVFWFADGSSLVGNSFLELTREIASIDRNEIQAYDWTGVDLTAESQGIDPKNTTSIQFAVIEMLKEEDFDIIYDDDGPGEIADIIAIRDKAEKIEINLYHLKWAQGGRPSNQIDNLYEVCGQVQKSVNWKFKEGRELFDHLLRRKIKKHLTIQCSRLERGTEDDLDRLLRIARQNKPTVFGINLVQPSISKSTASDGILTLLGVTSNFVHEFAGIKLVVIGSA